MWQKCTSLRCVQSHTLTVKDIQHYSFSFPPITFFLHTLTGPLLAEPLQSPLAPPRLSKGFSANSCIIISSCVQFANKSLLNINKSNYAKAMPCNKQLHQINTTKTIKPIIRLLSIYTTNQLRQRPSPCPGSPCLSIPFSPKYNYNSPFN